MGRRCPAISDHLNFKFARGSGRGKGLGARGNSGGRREIKGEITQQCLLLRNRKGAQGRKPRKIGLGILRVWNPVSPLRESVSRFNNSPIDRNSYNLILLKLFLLSFFCNLLSLSHF